MSGKTAAGACAANKGLGGSLHVNARQSKSRRRMRLVDRIWARRVVNANGSAQTLIGFGDSKEVGGFQTCTPNQRAIDIGDAKQLFGV